MEPGGETAGRLARTGNDADFFRLTAPPGDPGLWDIELTSTSEKDRKLCIWAEGERIQCRAGAGAVALPDLLLEPGEFLLELSGSVDEAGAYGLSVSEPRLWPADGEAEPNDDYLNASTFDADIGVTASSRSDDPDFHKVANLFRDVRSAARVRGRGRAPAP